MPAYLVYSAPMNLLPLGRSLPEAIGALFVGDKTARDHLATAEVLRDWLAELPGVVAHAERAGWRPQDGGRLVLHEIIVGRSPAEAGTTPCYIFTGADDDSPCFIVTSRSLGSTMEHFVVLRPGDP
jgi:hypothetical protein